MLDKVKLNFQRIIKQTIYMCGCLFTLITAFTSFVTWEDMDIDIDQRIKILIAIIIFSFLLSVVYIVVLKQNNFIWKSGSGKLQVCYGDIIQLGKHRNGKKQKIIVIPVNTCFDTLVDDDITQIDKPLISSKSIHGQWLKSLLEDGISLEYIDSKIDQSIAIHNIQPIRKYTREEKHRGKLNEFSVGTVIPISIKANITYFLFALCELDENNRAQCSEDTFNDGLEHLINCYNDIGQGFEIFIPLMGTGMSRMNIKHKDMLRRMRAIIELNRKKIKGTVNIVIYNQDSDKVSIFD